MRGFGMRAVAIAAGLIGIAMLVAFGVGQGVPRTDERATPMVAATPPTDRDPVDVFEIPRTLSDSRTARSPSEVPAPKAVPGSAAQVTLSFAPVVRAAAPAVVNIYTRTEIRRRFADPMFEMFFGQSFGAPARPQTSLGSGVIVDPRGVVLTNAHVIAGADEITVALKDRREFRARVLLKDERTDLAVLHVEAGGLPFLRFRDSDTMEVGDLVLAIGNPFGVGQTVTTGIISAQARSAEDGRVFIQTDAAINPGNSGGALVDMSGRLIGINTMILSPSGGSNGIGFAIPADLARQAMESATTGSPTIARAWLGIDGEPVTQDIAESLGLDRPSGVILSRVHPRSSLRAAGLQVGDVILDVEGLPVPDLAALDYRLGTGRLGQSLPVGYMRDGQRRKVEVRLSPPPEDPPRDTAEIGGHSPVSGAIVANVNPALAQENGLDPLLEGVIVLETARGPAARYGLRPGDMLREINGLPIRRVVDVEAALVRANGWWSVAVERNGQLLRLEARG